ncbi:helix-turn-helix domain-containing protein [Paenibacillus solisilvae]|uniref:Helix-turn-helix domain-containing protein n=1 Tax=Paenibacillus solisilvae TaxID=2486751 RepID=A0ABW0VR61_9BACL
MHESWIQSISPFVRAERIMQSSSLAGEWLDHDHVYTYIEQGEAEFFLSGVKYLAKEGDVLLMHPFMPHIIRSTSTLPLIQYIFHFDLYFDEERSRLNYTTAAMYKQTAKVEREMKLASIFPVSHIQAADRIEVKKRFLLMHRAFQEKREGYSLLTKSVCLELLYLFFKNQSDQKAIEGKMTKGWAFIERAVNYIHESYPDPQLNNESISRSAGVSTNHLSYLFKQQLGISIHKYVTHIRIEQAKCRIMEGKHTLTEIADTVGFSSIHLFSRSFKAAVGMTPSRFAASQASLLNVDDIAR